MPTPFRPLLSNLFVALDELVTVDPAVSQRAVERFFEAFDPHDGTEIDQCSYGCRDRDRSEQFAIDGIEHARDVDDDAVRFFGNRASDGA